MTTVSHRKKIYRRVIGCLIALVTLPVCLCFAWFGLVMLSEPVARSMAPPVYPNSALLGIENRSGLDGFSEYATYRTTDNPQTVRAWYKQEFPGLKLSEESTGGVHWYWWESNQNSLLLHLIALVNCGDWRLIPSAYLTIRPDRDNPALTVISIDISWPSP
jgi:hypothetical protein